MNRHRPPRILEALLRFLLPAGRAVDAALGDLHEGWVRRANRSAAYASLWYARQGVSLLRYRHPRTIAFGAYAGDVRVAMRSLLRRPFVLGMSALTLGPALGAAGVGLMLGYAVLFRPLPYPDAERLMVVGMRWGDYGVGQSNGLFFRYREEAQSVEALGLFRHRAVTVVPDDGHAHRVAAALVTSETLNLLGAVPLFGRLFAEEEDWGDAPPTVVVAHGFWQEELGADRDVIGRDMTIDGRSRTIVGVLPRAFDFPGADPLLILPAGIERSRPQYLLNGEWDGIGRLARGWSAERAQRELDEVLRRDLGRYPDHELTDALLNEYDIEAAVVPLLQWEVGKSAAFLRLLVMSVVLLLGLACGAMANAIVASAERRSGQLRVRRILGASRRRIFSLLVGESTVVCAIAIAVGVGVSMLFTQAVAPAAVFELPRAHLAGSSAAAVAIVVALGGTMIPLFAVLPLLATGTGRGGRPHDGRTSTSKNGLRTVLAATQVGFSTVLLVAALVLAAEAVERARAPLGIETPGRYTFRVTLPAESYATAESARRFHYAVADAISELPGVDDVAFGVGIPVLHPGWDTGWVVEGHPETLEAQPMHSYRHVSHRYLQTLGIPVLLGRGFTREDSERDRAVVVVNEAFARRYWTEPSAALNRRIRYAFGSDGDWFEIVGVAANTADDGRGSAAKPLIYQTLTVDAHDPYHLRFLYYVVRTDTPQSGVASSVRRIVAAVDREIPVFALQSLERAIHDTTVRERIALCAVLVSASTSLAVAAVGLTGIVLQSVGRRKKEIAIRKALGADDVRLRRSLLRDAMVPGVVGAAVGAGAIGLGARVPATLTTVAATAELPLAAAVVVMLLVLVLIAGYIGSRRVAVIEPAEALVAE